MKNRLKPNDERLRSSDKGLRQVIKGKPKSCANAQLFLWPFWSRKKADIVENPGNPTCSSLKKLTLSALDFGFLTGLY
jgi:hypothetical protein